MTPERFNQIFDEITDKCEKVLVDRGHMYARGGDRLSNFKSAAMLRSSSPIDSLGGLMSKQIVAVYDYINDTDQGVRHTIEEWEEKIYDSINYLILLRALIEDMHNAA